MSQHNGLSVGVLFPTPIGGDCGLVVESILQGPLARAYRIDCAFAPLGDVKVLSVQAR